MSTGSAASDAEDYEARYRRRRKERSSSRYLPQTYSDEEEEDEEEEGEAGEEEEVRAKPERCRGAGSREARQSQRNAANARERARMRVLSKAFSRLKTSLPWVPADTKLSKLDTLRLASSYICHLRQLLQDERMESGYNHPLTLTWPFMMSARSEDQDLSNTVRLCGATA